MKSYAKLFAILFGITLIIAAAVKFLTSSESLNGNDKRQTTNQENNIEYTETIETSASPIEPPETIPETVETAPDSTTTVSASTNAAPVPTKSVSNSANAAPAFYYSELTDSVIQRITGISYVENENVSLANLRYIHIQHYDFEGNVTDGELICNASIAKDLLDIFYALYQEKYPIEKVRLIDEYGGDDTASMEDNNTSCFNYRVVDGTTTLSKHAYGLAIDINPFYNPYVVPKPDGTTYISPKGSEIYVDRSADFPHKIGEGDLCYRLFKEHGFTWGGDWKTLKDYQHFQKVK